MKIEYQTFRFSEEKLKKIQQADVIIKEYGHTCWELDALDPGYISNLVTESVIALRDDSLWNMAMIEQGERRKELSLTSENWDSVLKMLKKLKP